VGFVSAGVSTDLIYSLLRVLIKYRMLGVVSTCVTTVIYFF